MGWDRFLHLLLLHALFAGIVFGGAWLCCLPSAWREVSFAGEPSRRNRPNSRPENREISAIRLLSARRPETTSTHFARAEVSSTHFARAEVSSTHFARVPSPGVPVSTPKNPAAATSFPATFPAHGGPLHPVSGPPHLLP